MNTTGGIETVLRQHTWRPDTEAGHFCACGFNVWEARDVNAGIFTAQAHRAHVAAALAAHLLSDAVVERAAVGLDELLDDADAGLTADLARAALAAAVGGDTDE